MPIINGIQELDSRGGAYDWTDSTAMNHLGTNLERRHEYAGVVIVQAATLKINADICVCKLTDFQLENCHFSNPANAYFDPEFHMVASSGQSVMGYLEVLPGTVNIIDNQLHTERIWGTTGIIHIENMSCGQIVKIYNISGQELYSFKVNSSEVKLSAPPGIYIVKFQNCSQKIVVY